MKFEELMNFYNNKYSIRFKFNELNKSISIDIDRKKYYDKWMEKYSNLFRSKNSNIHMEWSIRNSKAMKEIYHSATFYIESKKALENGMLGSFYFLCYYSLFHAMLSTLYYDITQNISNLININHSKVLNCFISNFNNKNNPIFPYDIKQYFLNLKFMRESYSYCMPLNEMFQPILKEHNPIETLEKYLILCYQISSFHSCLLSKNVNGSLDINGNLRNSFSKMFYKVNGTVNPNDGKLYLDPLNENEFYEIRKYHCWIEPFPIELDHFFDEFRGYNVDNPIYDVDKYLEIGTKAHRFVYDSLLY
ncbi:hypothetical protein [Inediibacterium massiliense]|uniref:hypothetical protein n=1 Tax=Inediibacterium massiliense TaxID=1658111 RepID=UPI0006B5FAFB|nr:hypothetical protein [Inediibacterium massiliense]